MGIAGIVLVSPDLCTVSFFLYLMMLKTISPGCGVQSSPMLFLPTCGQIHVLVSAVFHIEWYFKCCSHKLVLFTVVLIVFFCLLVSHLLC